jgi:2'-5' RNA ligase
MATPAGEAAPPSLRLFVALDLPDDWKRWVAAEQARLERTAPEVFRWVAPEQAHLTLAFLGSYPASRLQALTEALCAACSSAEPFALQLGELGVFGPPRRPRVVWVGLVEPAGRLAALQRRVVAALRQVGVALEDRPFAAHVTLGRARGATARPAGAEFLAALHASRSKPGPTFVEEVKLFESVLLPRGPQYTPRASCALGAARGRSVGEG